MLRHAVGDAGDDEAGIAGADESDIGQSLAGDHGCDILDMGVEIGRTGNQMRPLAKTRERRRENAMALRAQPLGDIAPIPAAAPGAVDQNEIRHVNRP